MENGKKIIIIAGPNGAGKTTFAKEYLPNEADCPIFVNADHIAAGLAPEAPESAAVQAGRLMLEKIDALAANGASFAVETTLSGRIYARKIGKWQADGYCVAMVFLSLKSPETAIARVAGRVRLGGHHIPPDVVRRRFHAGLKNFQKNFRKTLDIANLFANNGGHAKLLESETMTATKQTPNGLDTASVSAALHRAAKRAHFNAYQNGEGVVVRENEETVIAPPRAEMYGELLAEVERKRAEVEANYKRNGGE